VKKQRLTKAWWNTIKVVFCTVVQSGNKVFCRKYSPDVIIVDEAGLCTTPEMAIALSFHCDAVKTVILAGDDKQQNPVVTSQNRNEVYHMLRSSPLR
jgi:superfamily I DNA and/or RNA helicase